MMPNVAELLVRVRRECYRRREIIELPLAVRERSTITLESTISFIEEQSRRVEIDQGKVKRRDNAGYFKSRKLANFVEKLRRFILQDQPAINTSMVKLHRETARSLQLLLFRIESLEKDNYLLKAKLEALTARGDERN